MSKFFNETLKMRSGAAPEGRSREVVFHDLVETALSQGDSSVAAVEGTWLDSCRKLEHRLSELLASQFSGSDSLESVLEAYRALRTRLLKIGSQQGLRSVVITSASQGEGKTFTSLNLASCCAQLHDTRVLLIDGDIRSHGLSRRVGAVPGPGLSDVLAGSCTGESAILATDIPNLYLLPCGSPTASSAELFAGKAWQQLIEWCHDSFNLVLVDSPPILNLADVELMSAACEGVVMVVRAMATSRETLQKSTRQLDPKKLLGVVYNAAETGTQSYRYPAREN